MTGKLGDRIQRDSLSYAAASLVLLAGSLLALGGCTQNQCSNNSVCGEKNTATGLNGSQPAAAGDANLKISVDMNPFHAGSGDLIEAYGRDQEWMLPDHQVIKGDPGYASPDSFYLFAKSFHGVAVGKLVFGVTIQNLSGGVVYLRSMQIVNLVCSGSAQGTHIWEGGGADPVTPRAIVIDLDAKRPMPLYYPKIVNLNPSSETPGTFGFQVPGGQTEQFDIAALLTKSRRSCGFGLAMDTVINGKVETLSITDSGQPFRIDGSLGGSYWMYNGGGGPATWSRVGAVANTQSRLSGPNQALAVTDP
ncbi:MULTISPECIES: hypothetical protein [Streptacidiphilus]|uniref:Uncharacterized protein n=1 Tax=Streptacidiphilus cavernicola TaxID=3342716 RepID=A0ABV6UK36_9ACTN|nr:hypothetical protein [Streptacidiphilus jeojiense]